MDASLEKFDHGAVGACLAQPLHKNPHSKIYKNLWKYVSCAWWLMYCTFPITSVWVEHQGELSQNKSFPSKTRSPCLYPKDSTTNPSRAYKIFSHPWHGGRNFGCRTCYPENTWHLTKSGVPGYPGKSCSLEKQEIGKFRPHIRRRGRTFLVI